MIIHLQEIKFTLNLKRKRDKEKGKKLGLKTGKEYLVAELITQEPGIETIEMMTGDQYSSDRALDIPMWSLFKAWLTGKCLESINTQKNGICEKNRKENNR